MTSLKRFCFLIFICFVFDACSTKSLRGKSLKEAVEERSYNFLKCFDEKVETLSLKEAKVFLSWKINSAGKAYDINVVKTDIQSKKFLDCVFKILTDIKFATYGANYQSDVEIYPMLFKREPVLKKERLP